MDELSTLEARLREALDLGTAGTTPVTDLATAARRRAALRRQRRSAVGAVGVVAAVVAAGLALTTAVGDDPAEIPPTQDGRLTDDRRDVPSGWHREQWRGVEIHVPNTWESGTLAGWCRRGPLLGTPVVERPRDQASTRCTDPVLGYGVQFLSPRQSRRLTSHEVRPARPADAGTYPLQSWVGIACAGCDVAVRVVAPDEHVANYLLDSYASAPEPDPATRN